MTVPASLSTGAVQGALAGGSAQLGLNALVPANLGGLIPGP